MVNQNPEHFNRECSHPGETTINSSFLLWHVGLCFPSSSSKAMGQPTGELSQALLQLTLPFERAAPNHRRSGGTTWLTQVFGSHSATNSSRGKLELLRGALIIFH